MTAWPNNENNLTVEHLNQVNVVIKTLFCGIPDDEMNDTLDTFWSECNAFNYKNGIYDSDDFIWISKDILQGNSHIWHQKHSLPYTKVLGFLASMVTSKMIGIGAAKCSWGDVKTIKYDNISSIISDVSDKQSIVSAYDCIESGRIAQSESDFNIDEIIQDMYGIIMMRFLIIIWKMGCRQDCSRQTNINNKRVACLY